MRDLSGDIKSVLFYPDPSTIGGFEFSDLRAGCTLCIRYAQRCFFSDLATEAIKVRGGVGRGDLRAGCALFINYAQRCSWQHGNRGKDPVGTRLATEMVTTWAGGEGVDRGVGPRR